MEICIPDTTNWSCYGTPEQVGELDADLKEISEQFAWAALARLTGFRLSLCAVTIEPCAVRCSPPVWITAHVGVSETFTPFLQGGKWYNSCGCTSRGACRCVDLPEIILPSEASGPITVTVGGSVLDPTAYRVENGNRLVRTDGGRWPICPDDTGDGPFTVSYYPGVGPDELLSYAAGLLAAEYYKSCKGEECRLPSNVTDVSRQGLQFRIPADAFASGLSGIREVDDVVAIYNPYRLRTPSRVMSPSTRRARMRTA